MFGLAHYFIMTLARRKYALMNPTHMVTTTARATHGQLRSNAITKLILSDAIDTHIILAGLITKLHQKEYWVSNLGR